MTSASSPCNLLLVDDSEDDIYLLQRALVRHPQFHVVGHASDGDAAIEYLSGVGDFADRERHPLPDLMVLDLKMPGRDGYDVLEWIRGKSPRPRVAVFTASSLETDKTRSTQLGADLFQTKAFDMGSLDRFITRLYSLCKPSPM
jgi:CheY-like chemotaxis protein